MVWFWVRKNLVLHSMKTRTEYIFVITVHFSLLIQNWKLQVCFFFR